MKPDLPADVHAECPWCELRLLDNEVRAGRCYLCGWRGKPRLVSHIAEEVLSALASPERKP